MSAEIPATHERQAISLFQPEIVRRALIDSVKRDAAKGKTSWRVTTAWQGQARSRAEE